MNKKHLRSQTSAMPNLRNMKQFSQPYYPTLAHEFHGFKVSGKFVFKMLELMATPTNLANQVEVGHTIDQSHRVQSYIYIYGTGNWKGNCM